MFSPLHGTLQMKNSMRIASAINPVTMENTDDLWQSVEGSHNNYATTL